MDHNRSLHLDRLRKCLGEIPSLRELAGLADNVQFQHWKDRAAQI